MIDLLTLSIGVGLVVALLFAEFFGFKAGGLVVPGYFAVFLTQPLNILITLAVAVATFWCLRLLASIVIIYGKRRTAFAILFGYVIGALARTGLDLPAVGGAGPEAQVIGYIIPGLIALWMDRQGIVETITSLATVSAVVRLMLIILVPVQLQEFEHRLAPDPVEVQEITAFEQARED